jgi:putative tricarboxylic transport membrane protein
MYDGSTTAILINMPVESASVITCIDGYKLTKKGALMRYSPLSQSALL